MPVEESGLLWEHTFDAVTDLIAILDTQHRIVRVNKAMAERLGRPAAECVGLFCYQCVHGAECSPLFCPHARTLATGQQQSEEIHDEGLGGDFVVTTTPLLDAEGHMSGSVHVAHEITEYKQAMEALRRGNERLALLSDVSARLLATDNPQAIVNELCTAVMAYLDCQLFFNFITDASSGRLRLNACAGIAAEEAQRIEWLDYGVAVCGCVARDGCRIVAEAIATTPDPRTELVKSYGVQAYACHPLLAGGGVIGTLSFGTTTRSHFTADELALMKTVADQVALAMERIRQKAELRQLNRILTARSRGDQVMMRATEETAYLAQVCDIIVRDCGHAMVWIGYTEQDAEKTVRPVASAGFEAGYLDTLRISWADTERGRGPTGTAIRTGKPALCRNMLTDPLFAPWRPQALARGYASSLVLPLLQGDAVLGAITIYAREPDAFSTDEIALLQELAGDLAYGISALRLRAAHARAEEALRQNEERFRTLFTSMSEGFALHEIICAADGTPCDYRFLELNPAFERLTGLQRANVVGHTCREVMGEETRQWVDIYGKVALTGETVRFENYSPALERYFEIFAFSPLAGHFAVVFTDITARKQMEGKLTWLASFPERNPTPIAEIAIEDGTVYYQNPTAVRLFPDLRRQGFQHPWLAGLDTLAHELLWQVDNRAQREVVCGQTYFAQTVTCIAETRRLRVYGYDITERKQAEEAQRQLAAIIESSDDAIIGKTLDGIVTSWNPAAERLYGYTASEMTGQSLNLIIPPDCRDELTDFLARVSHGEWVEHYETTRVAKGGRRFAVSVTVSPIKDAAGRTVGASSITRDISERKQAEEDLRRTAAELARSNKELEQFAYVASHDLQEPLRAVAGYVSLLETRMADRLDEKARLHIEGAIQGASRMQRLITDLLALSRVGTQGKDFAPTDMNVLLTQVLQSMQVSVRESGASITADPLPTLNVDAGQLTQLLQNLLGNAIKFHGDRPPEIHLGAQQQDDAWLFSVRDNGLGIEPQYFERIFLIFQRLHTRKQYPGTGIGLAICKKIVERHHGTIWVESQPDQGSTFYFTLPHRGTL